MLKDGTSESTEPKICVPPLRRILSKICWINCDNCGTVDIEDSADIVLWHTQDLIRIICEITCPRCMQPTTESIGSIPEQFFRGHGARTKDLNDKYEPLTETDIDNWNMMEELDEIFP